MGRPQITYTEEQKAEIKKAYRTSKNKKERSRLLCIKLRVLKGMPTKQIAEITDLSPIYVNIIIGSFVKSGVESLMSKPQTSHNRNMTVEQEEEFLKPYKEKAIAGEILEISSILKAYSKALDNKKVSKSTVYNLLHRNGWRKIMPRSQHPKKASDEAIEAYKKNV
jgi:transposase